MSGITTIETLLFNVRLSIRYHTRRRSFFDTLNLVANFSSVIFGSAAMAAMIKEWNGVAVYSAAFVSFASGLNLVLRTNERSRLHHDLAKRFIELERKVLPANADQFFDLYSLKLQIEADEPPALSILSYMCHNEQISAEGILADRMVKLTCLQRFLSSFIDLPPTPSLPPRD